jgi:hypothetical protein
LPNSSCSARSASGLLRTHKGSVGIRARYLPRVHSRPRSSELAGTCSRSFGGTRSIALTSWDTVDLSCVALGYLALLAHSTHTGNMPSPPPNFSQYIFSRLERSEMTIGFRDSYTNGPLTDVDAASRIEWYKAIGPGLADAPREDSDLREQLHASRANVMLGTVLYPWSWPTSARLSSPTYPARCCSRALWRVISVCVNRSSFSTRPAPAHVTAQAAPARSGVAGRQTMYDRIRSVRWNDERRPVHRKRTPLVRPQKSYGLIWIAGGGGGSGTSCSAWRSTPQHLPNSRQRR